MNSLAVSDTFSLFSPIMNVGVSSDARAVKVTIEAVMKDMMQQSIFMAEPYWKANDALLTAYHNAQNENWDGYGAKRASPIAYAYAQRFLRMLPMNVPVPDVLVDPDGEISFEWDKGARQVFSVSVGDRRELTYAAILGGSKHHGVVSFSDEIPKNILDILEEFAPAA